MITKIGLPLLAIGLIAFALNFLLNAQTRLPEVPPPIAPAENPFENTVAGAGIVEPETENISLGSPVAGIVVEVLARVGQRVSKGDALFRIDDRQLNAQLAVKEAMHADAKAVLERLANMPRPEELPRALAQVHEAQADYVNWQQKWARTEELTSRGALSPEEIFERKQQAAQARERYNHALAEYKLLEAGAWKYDKEVAKAAVDRAAAEVAQTKKEIERLEVRALVDGEVLQVNVRPGEFVGAQPGQALVMLGNVKQLHVRVDIDEYDIPRFIASATARATLKGQPDVSFPLRFVRVEPFVVPKKSLTGDNTERVDTRVLQVIYAIDTEGKRLFVGQQVDVFIDATPAGEGEKRIESSQ
ncbi:MAG: efflux RND transporter periplasmic adaptor subunit [Pirellulales bacterium]